PTSRTSHRLCRRAVLGIVAAGTLACLLPALRYAPVQAQPQKDQADAKASGRIYVSASLRYKPAGKDQEETHHRMIIAIDPDTGKWQKISDRGSYGRVSPDRQTLVFGRGDEIWNCDTQGTNNPGKISDKSGQPVWSPDGRHLVATKQEFMGGRWKDETWRMD